MIPSIWNFPTFQVIIESFTEHRSFLKTIFAYMQTMPVIGGFLSKNIFTLIPTGKSTFIHKLVDMASASDGKKEKAEV